MAGKVRIFELAKELGMTSKELIALFGRLGLEAKNQLSVVDDKIAGLLRAQLKAKPAPPPPAAAEPAAPPPQKAPQPRAAPARATAPPAEPPVTLKPVVGQPRRSTPRPAAPGAQPPAQAPAAAQPSAAQAAQPRTRSAAAQTPGAAIPQLRPVPRGQTSVAPPASPNGASATPGPQTGAPGRPGVAPRPGQPGLPGQGYQPRPGQQAPGRAVGPGGRPRPAGNGPFRPLPPRSGGAQPGGPLPQTGPTPSSGAPGRDGGRGPRDRDDKLSKKDREKELLLEKNRKQKRGSLDAAPATPPAKLEKIEIPDLLTVQELATSMIVPAKDVIKELIKMGTMATINQNIPSETAIQVARKFGFEAIVKEAGEEVVVEQEEDRPELMTARPPVVTVLGHVDHGKTSLLDKIRVTNVAAGEAGGITQRIGAYTVEKNNRKITFIDTPGHEAFTAMRARGAKVTDVAVLVVAADDGVMPQTVEAISHIRAAEVPIVVAINKIDKPEANIDNVKSQLAEQQLQPVDWGGKVEMVPVSARNGDGIDKLLETVLLEADILDLKANKNRRASGVVIESALDRGRGAVATVLVQNGTLRVGDVVVAGGTFGKIRALIDDTGKQVKKAGPAIPVEVMGLSDVPSAGDALLVVSDERVAREAAAKRSTKRRDVRIQTATGPKITLETFLQMTADGAAKTLNLVIKADGQGAVEALRARVESLSTAEVNIRVIFAGVGAITPNDVNLASASNAVLIGFNIRPDETVKRLAASEQVDLRFYQVIYD
ncbi:MAG: translation initiation factor IF-2, partial [Candidatus Eremiobacteraeota bacterium]|nr:translation initiation factor IF-2 [Candidatus Eremiobacteraeota bacterium]